MPLLYKRTFEKNELPEDLDDSDEVFYCELTNEIFKDYEEFCERIILCNSLVWACSLSGRANLTYQEALVSEENAKSMLNDFPMELRIPVLYLTTLTQRKSLNELAEDVYCFAKDRYFIGENVEVEIAGSSSTSCNITQVLEPSQEDLNSRQKQSQKNGERQYWPPADLYRYVVQPIGDEKLKPVKVLADSIHRKKSVYSRAKNRLYIKQFTEQVNGVWQLKPVTFDKYGISRVKFNQIFAGEAPDLSPSPKKCSPNTLNKSVGVGKKRQESIDKYFTKKSPSKQQHIQSPQYVESQQKTLLQKLKDKYKAQNSKQSSLSNKISGKQDPFRQKRKYTKKKLLQSSDKNSILTEIELKQKKKEEKLELREQRKNKKVQIAMMMKEYNRKKEDLELEDLQELPVPIPIDLRIPNERFGEFAMIMEFLNTYKDTVNLKDYFPGGITIDILERALVDSEVAGPLCDILQMLLSAIFELQEEEDDEIREDSDFKASDWQEIVDIGGDIKAKEAVRQATLAARWAQAYHRTPLSKLTLDASTLTEVLRLHLLASGGRCGDGSSKWRYQQRGGYSSLDDPGLMLRLTQPHIFESLSLIPFCDLELGDKLSILSCLINQILTFSAVRDVIDERMDKIKQGKVELRSLHANDKRREQEAQIKVKDGEWTIEQLEKERELLHRRKQDQSRRARELSDENLINQILPLGVDRAYRRFWMFPSIPGLFVEDDERHAGSCLPKGTPPLNLGLLNGEDPELYIKRLFEEGSNKENLATTPIKNALSPAKTPIKSANRSPSNTTTLNKKMSDDRLKNNRPLTCWSNSSCPVHCKNNNKIYWSFFKDEAEVNALIENLNKRGIRECTLQSILEEEKDRIIQSVNKCPISKLNPKLCPVDETRKSSRNNPRYDNANLNFPAGTSSEEILETVLRDLILETEEKINNGYLGCLKVQDRLAWREAITNNTYDPQCEGLSWGNLGRSNKVLNCEIAEEDGVSRPTTPSSDASFRDLQVDAAIEQRHKVRELASAILQLEQSVDPKYLKRPLGKGSEKKENNEKGDQAAQVARERWEASLMASTSLSQLFLHISTLDSSITWARSILKAYCRLCKRKGDPEKMLLCDGCNKGHHMYCLKPKLVNVPRGDWFCAKCKPREKSSPVKKNRRIFTEESDDEEENNSEKSLLIGQCKVCRSKGEVISCENCNEGYHFACIVPILRKVPSGNWYCQKCRRGTNGNKKASDESSPLSDSERSSRRRSSKAATAKISQFAKQLRNSAWEVESDESLEKDGVRRRSRRSLESELVVTSNSAAKDLPLDNATLQEILDQLMHHEDAWPFLRPVTKADVEDYHQIIKHPMDYGTIKHKLNMLEYSNNSEVLADALLIFENCYAYNKEDTDIYQCGLRLHNFFQKLCKDRGLELNDGDDEKAPATKKLRLAV